MYDVLLLYWWSNEAHHRRVNMAENIARQGSRLLLAKTGDSAGQFYNLESAPFKLNGHWSDLISQSFC